MCYWLNRLWFIHKTEYYVVMKNNQEKDLFELTWNYFQDILISKKKKTQYKRIYLICYILHKRKEKCISSLQKKKHKKDKPETTVNGYLWRV